MSNTIDQKYMDIAIISYNNNKKNKKQYENLQNCTCYIIINFSM